MMEYPGKAVVALSGVTDAVRGEVPTPFVEAVPQAHGSTNDLQAWCRATIAPIRFRVIKAKDCP